jgi:hypothetical protein
MRIKADVDNLRVPAVQGSEIEPVAPDGVGESGRMIRGAAPRRAAMLADSSPFSVCSYPAVGTGPFPSPLNLSGPL